MAVDISTFKGALAQWGAGVSVITTRLSDGSIHGMTASSFTSVSLEPPLVMVCIGKKLTTHQFISESGVFAVNILGIKQVEWGKIFAGLYPDIQDRFNGIPFKSAVTGSPILPNVLGWVDCTVYHQYDAGDHTIFIGLVEDAMGSDEHEPLMYFKRNWGRFEKLEK